MEETFWERTNRLIKDCGFTQESLTQQCGFSDSRRIQNLSGSGRLPRASELVRIAKELRTSVEYLVMGAGIPSEISALSQKIANLSSKDRDEIMLLVDHKLKKQKVTSIKDYKYSETSDVHPVYEFAAESASSIYFPIREKVIDNVVFLDWGAVEVPLLGSTAAGRSIDFGDIDPHPPTRPWASDLIRGDPNNYYCVLVQGDSMTHADIKDGDYALLCRAGGAENGEIMLVRHDNSSTLKRIKITEGKNGREETYICWEDGSGYTEKLGRNHEIQGRLVAIERKPGKRTK